VLLRFADSVGADKYRTISATANGSMRLLVGATALALVIGLALAFFVSRGVAQGVKQIQRVLTSMTEQCAAALERGLAAMARNDLTVPVRMVTQPIPRHGRDEIGRTAAVTNAMLGRLERTIASYERARAGMAGMANDILAAAHEVAGASEQLE